MAQRLMGVVLALLLMAGCGGDNDQAGGANGDSDGAWSWPTREAEDDPSPPEPELPETTTTTSTTTTTLAPLELGEVVISGESLPYLGADSEAVGMQAPTLAGEGFAGESIRVGPYERPTIVLFVTHWCPFCQEAVAELSPWWDSDASPTDVDVIAVSSGVDRSRGNYPVSEWLEREGWGVPTLLDDDESSAAVAFGLTGYPFWVVIAADGTVVDQVSGSIGLAEVEALIDRARAG